MNIYSCYWPISNNMGDLIGRWILEKMTGGQVIYAEANAEYEHYVFGGSVLNHCNKTAIVWGAGLGTITDGVNAEADIKAVRGPISRARALSLGAKCPAIYGDPGLLLPKFIPKPSAAPTHEVGVVGHYVDQLRAFSRYPDYHVIDVCKSIESVVEEINACKSIISSSLHGIIVAHAYGIPATWVKMSDSLGGDGTKFRDYFMSVGMDVPQAFDCREKPLNFRLEWFVPELNTHEFWMACPINQEFRKPEFRTIGK